MRNVMGGEQLRSLSAGLHENGVGVVGATAFAARRRRMSFIDERVGLPYRSQQYSTCEPVLLRRELPQLLKRFCATTMGQHIVVIQGGNRYMACFLSLQLGRVVHSFKLVDVSKVRLSVLLNTMLLPEERVLKMAFAQQEVIRAAYFSSSQRTQDAVKSRCRALGFTSLEDFLGRTDICTALQVFAGTAISSPFSYPADDRRIKTEFALIDTAATNAVRGFEHVEIIRTLLKQSSMCKVMCDTSQKVAYLDDVFYRGRTYYTLLFLTMLLGVPKERWTLFTLCSDRVSKNIYSDRISVLKRGVLYPFENSIQSEKGYWEERPEYFVFRDIQEHAGELATKISHPTKEIVASWKQQLKDIVTQLRLRHLPRATVEALVEVFIHCKARRKRMHVEALVDQRAKEIGFCVPFVRLMSKWINQEEPRWKRQNYKEKVRTCFEVMTKVAQGGMKQHFSNAIAFYRSHGNELDHYYLKQFCDSR